MKQRQQSSKRWYKTHFVPKERLSFPLHSSGVIWRWRGAMKQVCWLFVPCSNVKTSALTGWRSLVNKQFSSPSLSTVFQWNEPTGLQRNLTVHVRMTTFILVSISFYRTQYGLLGFMTLKPCKCVFFTHNIVINLSATRLSEKSKEVIYIVKTTMIWKEWPASPMDNTEHRTV